MRYLIRTLLGMGLFAFCWIAVGYGIYQMLQIGTCASGGPYVSARQCPDGTTGLFLALTGGILGHFLAAGIYAGRGKPPGAGSPPGIGGVIVWFWTGLFWSLAAGCFLAVWGPEANPGPGGKLGGLIVAFMAVPMGALGLLALDLGRTGRGRARPLVAPMAATASRLGAALGAGNPVEAASRSVDRLDTLDRLRRQGTLTEAEFETLKQKIVEGA